MRYLLFLLLPLMIACPPQDRMGSVKKEKGSSEFILKQNIDPAEYEMLSYLDVLPMNGLSMNDKTVANKADICQALFSAHAFNGHIVLSSSEGTNETPFFKEVVKEINDCHFKYLQLQAADLYDKTYGSLSEKTQTNIQTMFPLELIYARVE